MKSTILACAAALGAAQVVLDGSQAVAAAQATVKCIKAKDFACLDNLFDESMTAQVVGYLPATPDICGMMDKQGFIDHIKGWQSSWDNGFTYFGNPKFSVPSYDSVGLLGSVNWFLVGSHEPALASDVVFFVTVNAEGTKITRWLEYANMAPQANMTGMNSVLTSMSTALATKNVKGMLDQLTPSWTGTTYSQSAISAASSIDAPTLSQVLSSSFQNQTAAVKDTQFAYSSCGYTYSHWVYMINSDVPGSRVIMEGLSLDTLDSNYQSTSTLRFVSAKSADEAQASHTGTFPW
jgi:hypothetical protein